MSVKVIENIPADLVEQMERVAWDAGATDVRRRQEGDGQFTLIITYPDIQSFAEVDARRAAPWGSRQGAD